MSTKVYNIKDLDVCCTCLTNMVAISKYPKVEHNLCKLCLESNVGCPVCTVCNRKRLRWNEYYYFLCTLKPDSDRIKMKECYNIETKYRQYIMCKYCRHKNKKSKNY